MESFYVTIFFAMALILCNGYDSLTATFPRESKFWKYKSNFGEVNNIRYNNVNAAPNVAKGNLVCIHGFGGNCDQFRKNIPYLAQQGYNSYAIDLLGYGYSDKPNPKEREVNEIYNFDTWTHQTLEFISDVVKEPSILVCNSIGGIVGLQAAIQSPDLVQGVVLIDISLRMLHVQNQPILLRPFVSLLQVRIILIMKTKYINIFIFIYFEIFDISKTVLRETNIGTSFFKQIAKPDVLRKILREAYADPTSIDDETLDIILKPGLTPGAAEVFLDFISYRYNIIIGTKLL